METSSQGTNDFQPAVIVKANGAVEPLPADFGTPDTLEWPAEAAGGGGTKKSYQRQSLGNDGIAVYVEAGKKASDLSPNTQQQIRKIASQFTGRDYGHSGR